MPLVTKGKATDGSGQQRLDPGRANKIVERQTAHVVGRPQHLAMAVTGLQVRVVIFAVGHEADRIDETQRAMEILEAEALDDGLAVVRQPPAGELRQQFLRLVRRDRVFLALARLAVLVGEVVVVHCGLRQWKRRSVRVARGKVKTLLSAIFSTPDAKAFPISGLLRGAGGRTSG